MNEPTEPTPIEPEESPELELEFLGALYERYAPRVAKFFANRRFSREDVQDLTQETFLSAFRQLATLRSQGKFEAWLFKIAANKWRNACRDCAAARAHVQETTSAEELVERGDAALDGGQEHGDPLRIVLIEEEHRLLREALADLSPPLRSAALLRLDQELSYEEIAKVLKIPIGTVKSRLNQATRQLQRSLGEAFGEVSL